MTNEEKKAMMFDEERLTNWAGVVSLSLASMDNNMLYDYKSTKTIYLNSIMGIEDDLTKLVKTAIAHTKNTMGRNIGCGEFSYWGIYEAKADVIILRFYEEFYFISLLYRMKCA